MIVKSLYKLYGKKLYAPAAVGGLGSEPGTAGAPYPWLTIRQGPDGTAHWQVMHDAAFIVAGMLNQFSTGEAITHINSESVPNQTIILGRRISASLGDMARVVDEHRAGRGIIMIGDPLTGGDSEVTVWLTDFIPAPSMNAQQLASDWYVLLEPDAGWRAGPQPSGSVDVVVREVQRAAIGLQWGTIIGGVVGLGLIAAFEIKGKSR